jgi:hypothetical protein
MNHDGLIDENEVFENLVVEEDARRKYEYFPIIDPEKDFIGNDFSFETRCVIACRIQCAIIQAPFLWSIQREKMDYFNFNEDEIFDARDSSLSEYKELREE